MNQPAVRTTGLVKTYGDVDALGPLDLEVDEGETVVLIGHNGSGKSTLLGMLAGMLEPSEGEILVAGAAPDALRVRQLRSWLPDNPVLYDDLSVREHLEFTIRMHGGRGDESIIDDLVTRLGLSGREDDLPSQFSRGLRQKTAAAVALVRPFFILLVDEPFVGLDTSGRAALLELFADAKAGGATLIVATHDRDVIAGFDRALVLEDGQLIYDGPTSGVGEHLGAT